MGRRIPLGVEPFLPGGLGCSQTLSDILEPGRSHSHLRVHIKVDALIGAHFPTQRPQDIARLPQIPAQKFSILETTGIKSVSLSSPTDSLILSLPCLQLSLPESLNWFLPSHRLWALTNTFRAPEKKRLPSG